ncbi:MAG TPA: hypothetical protein VF108_13885, partial [Actinomycetota bacterium]
MRHLEGGAARTGDLERVLEALHRGREIASPHEGAPDDAAKERRVLRLPAGAAAPSHRVRGQRERIVERALEREALR